MKIYGLGGGIAVDKFDDGVPHLYTGCQLVPDTDDNTLTIVAGGGDVIQKKPFAEITDATGAAYPSFAALIQALAPFAEATLGGGKLNIVTSLYDLPAPVAGVITLPQDYCYLFAGHVDLMGNRMVAGGNVCIKGTSSETAFITSTGLVGQPLIYTEFSLPMQDLTILDVPIAVSINGTGNPNLAIDWTAVNFINCGQTVLVNSCSNFLNFQCAYLNTGQSTFQGTIGTVGFDSCIFTAFGDQTLVVATGDINITRRFRFVFCAFVIGIEATGISYEVGFIIPNDQAIIESCNFSGAGVYIVGISSTDNVADWRDNKGIQNTASAGGYYMVGNATVTLIDQNVYAKILGATTANNYIRRFTHISGNEIVYAGSLQIVVKLSVTLSANSGNNQKLAFQIFKNGVAIADSIQKVTTSGTGRSENIKLQTVTMCAENDSFSVYCTNQTSGTDVTVTELNLIIERLD